MTPTEQEQLFVRAQTKFPNWTARKLSGYVHGVADAMAEKPINPVYALQYPSSDPYVVGYVYGYYDGVGYEAAPEPKLVGPNAVDFQWWTDETFTT